MRQEDQQLPYFLAQSLLVHDRQTANRGSLLPGRIFENLKMAQGRSARLFSFVQLILGRARVEQEVSRLGIVLKAGHGLACHEPRMVLIAHRERRTQPSDHHTGEGGYRSHRH